MRRWMWRKENDKNCGDGGNSRMTRKSNNIVEEEEEEEEGNKIEKGEG